jgi:hypothetical protein
MPNYLWGFSNSTSNAAPGGSSATNAVTPLPRLGPAGSGPNSISNKGSTLGSQLVNVVRDFYWTYSKPGDVSRAEVPRIILTERKLLTNALISQLKYSVGALANTAPEAAAKMRRLGVDTGLTGLLGSTVTEATNAAANIITTGGKILSNVNSYVSSSKLNTLDKNPTINSSQWLKPYQNLYLTEPTGWKYILPYFDNNNASQSNSFSDSGSIGGIGKFFGQASELATEAVEIAASLTSPTQVTYVERAKFYNYSSDSGESVVVEFPLINTGSVTYDDVVRNWQLVFLLLYQNRPGKTGFNTVDQPVIYQVEVPSTKFFPYCYISSINIDFVGSRREMSINVPVSTSLTNNAATSVTAQSNIRKIPAVIPDSYKVRIVLQSMTANTKNFMQHMIANHDIIETQ